MSLKDYEVSRDKFELLDTTNDYLSFPCACCKHKVKDCNDEPCRTCDHNIMAVEEDR